MKTTLVTLITLAILKLTLATMIKPSCNYDHRFKISDFVYSLKNVQKAQGATYPNHLKQFSTVLNINVEVMASILLMEYLYMMLSISAVSQITLAEQYFS